MLATIGSAIGLFAATNIDDIVVLTVLFLASSRGKPRPWQIVAGQYLGFITLVVISVIAALGLTIVPDEWVGFLGLIPLGIGIWTLIRGLRRNGDDDDDDSKITADCGASLVSRSPTGRTTSPSTRRSSAPARPATSRS
ncbi:cadmium resistance transporter [Microbacterium oxydans]|uniref:cadmium resistance transporter n=1 Tax=Microbacterium oxydans TaxID=82380 RepID=UPI000F8F8E8E|nr:cadmium resistance transporter [Microbacterium oxydans]AZS46159.1 hypothetical protein CVS53_00827 [Microbacterium oxydans]